MDAPPGQEVEDGKEDAEEGADTAADQARASSSNSSKKKKKKKKQTASDSPDVAQNDVKAPPRRCEANGDAEEVDGEEGGADAAADAGEAGAGAAKKKKKKNKKKRSAGVPTCPGGTGSKVAPAKGCDWLHGQLCQARADRATTIPVEDLFEEGSFPEGEILEHPRDFNSFRITSEEKRAEERLQYAGLYDKARKAAEVHRQVRRHAQSYIKPGIKLIDMCTMLEEKNRELVRENGLDAGIAFPTGCSLNHVAAHYTPNNGDDTVLKHGDVMKVDFGTQVEGRIIDCAWTVSFDPQFDPLLEAAREATNTGIKNAGIDVPLNEVGAAIQEVMRATR
ncbi:unnamed protein product [Ectocarpus fasciculatus]